MLTPLSPAPTVFPYTHERLYCCESCCFRCSLRTLQTQVATMIVKLPDGAWEKKVKPLMVLPLLHRLSLVDPLRRMPLSWLDAEKFPSEYPDHPDRVVGRYWVLCEMAKAGPVNDGEGYRGGFFKHMHRLACGLLDALRTERVVPADVCLGLRQQIYILGGNDGIVNEIKEFVTLANRGVKMNIENRAVILDRYGALDYAVFLVEKMDGSVSNSEMVRERLGTLHKELMVVKQNTVSKYKALVMALHPRSTNTAIKMLGSDLLRLCVKSVTIERVVSWEEVLIDWLWPVLVGDEECV